MAELLDLIVSHPYSDMVIVLSVLAAVGFLMFFWGFTGYILAHGDEDHQQHARVQMINGIFLFLVIMIAWEIIRWVLGLFQ